METEKIDLVGELNKLIIINNDRVVGYEKAAAETDDSQLKSLFLKFSSQSRKFNAELASEVRKAGGETETGTTTSGKFYRAWMDIKAALTGKDRKAIVGSCEFGEDVAKDTYKEFLKDNHIPGAMFDLVTSQYKELNAMHDEIKSLRDSL